VSSRWSVSGELPGQGEARSPCAGCQASALSVCCAGILSRVVARHRRFHGDSVSRRLLRACRCLPCRRPVAAPARPRDEGQDSPRCVFVSAPPRFPGMTGGGHRQDDSTPCPPHCHRRDRAHDLPEAGGIRDVSSLLPHRLGLFNAADPLRLAAVPPEINNLWHHGKSRLTRLRACIRVRLAHPSRADAVDRGLVLRRRGHPGSSGGDGVFRMILVFVRIRRACRRPGNGWPEPLREERRCRAPVRF
jgi:hypothetical protein